MTISKKAQETTERLEKFMDEYINPNTLRRTPTPTLTFQDYRSASPNCATPEPE